MNITVDRSGWYVLAHSMNPWAECEIAGIAPPGPLERRAAIFGEAVWRLSR
jgi:hypothetical protein